jgi:hypothetical protein
MAGIQRQIYGFGYADSILDIKARALIGQIPRNAVYHRGFPE